MSNTPASLRSDRPAEFPGMGGRLPSDCLAELPGILIEIMKRLKEAGELLGIKVLDHVIIGEGRYFSFSEKG